ncbi:MAG TPA: hypothetical protein VHJ82_09080 [Actinomycetota bacterium]|nr:hypothetical protein [Actinomycetota bacterium]
MDAAPLEQRDVIDIVVVGFENRAVVERQMDGLRDNFTDPFHYTLLDNSPSSPSRAELRALCETTDVGYVDLPKNPATGRDPSRSHGLALNWGYRHVLRPRGARWAGVLDPDVFPERRTSVLQILRAQPCFGVPQHRDDRWYLWPGLAFFDTTYFRDLNFLPEPGLDTGGANWRFLRALDPTTLREPDRRYVPAPSTVVGQYERIGDWLHTFNSSGWR